MELKGIKQWDGTAPDFDVTQLEDGYVHFVRTDTLKEEGYIYLNGKKYGTMPDVIDCGEY